MPFGPMSETLPVWATAPITLSMLKSRGPHCTNPTDKLGRILGVHVKEMAHRRPHRFFAWVVERHPNFAVKNFECWAVPILDDIMMGGKARVNEGAQVFTDCFAPVPICHAQVAHRILGKAVHAFAKGFLINF